MKTEIFTLSDNTQNYGTKAVIVGTFNEIASQNYPVRVPFATLIIRIAFEPSERFGGSELTINGFHKQDPELKIADFKFVLPPDDSIDETKRHFTNITLNLDGMVLPKSGTYVFRISVGGWHDDIELYANRKKD